MANVQKLGAKMPNWCVKGVVKFIEKHDTITQNASRFAENEIDGDTISHLLGMFKRGPEPKIRLIGFISEFQTFSWHKHN